MCLIALVCLGVGRANAQNFDQFDSKKGLSVSGAANFSAVGYTVSGIEARRDPLDYFVTANLNFGIYGYSLPFSFAYTNRRTSYTQPFNSFKFSPSYKWARAYIGRTSMTFSPYTLGGHLFNGVGVELTPGKWEIAAMYGKLKDAVDPSVEDNLGEPSFKRTGYGLKLGYNGNNLNTGIIVFRARDDENSLKYLPLETQLRPMDNTAIGMNIRKGFGRFFADAEYTFSILSQRPSSFFSDNNSEAYRDATRRYFDAMNFGLGYQADWWGLQLRYERIAPDYQSLGAYYFTNDMQNITIVPNLRLASGKMVIGGNLGFQRDNLSKRKETDTRRFVGAVNVAYVPNQKWNISANYSNFNSFTKYRLQADPYMRDELDSLNFYQISQSLNTNLAYNFGSSQRAQNLILNLAYQRSSQEQKANPNMSGSDIYNGSLTYACNFTPENIALAFSCNYTDSKSANMQSSFIGPSTNLSKAFFSNVLRASYGVNYSLNKTLTDQSRNNSSILNNRIGFNFTPKSEAKGKHNLGLNIIYMLLFASGESAGYKEFTSTFNYVYSF